MQKREGLNTLRTGQEDKKNPSRANKWGKRGLRGIVLSGKGEMTNDEPADVKATFKEGGDRRELIQGSQIGGRLLPVK